jgi:hypothetical protein
MSFAVKTILAAEVSSASELAATLNDTVVAWMNSFDDNIKLVEA